MNKQELKNRTKAFAVRVFRFLTTMETSKPVNVISNQLLKSSSSIAANYRSVCRGKSDADFLNKLKMVDEEADESLFWLEFINDLEIKCDETELHYLLKEANELVSIFSASIRTIKSKDSNPESESPKSQMFNPKSQIPAPPTGKPNPKFWAPGKAKSQIPGPKSQIPNPKS